MKKLLSTLFVIFCCCIQTLNAQDYKPFPIENAMWREVSNASDCKTGEIEDYQYLITGDSVIHNKTYNKLQRTGCVKFYDFEQVHIFPFDEYAGCFRNDIHEKKIWYIFPDDDFEQLLYDFNLQLYDSVYVKLNSGYTTYIGVVTNIDDVSLSDGLHKRFQIFWEQLSGASFNGYSYIIEGIGSTMGLLFFAEERLSYMSPFVIELKCFSLDGEAIYINPKPLFADCTPVAIENYAQSKSKITLYPNPVYDTFQIQGVVPFQNYNISIYNMYGQIVMQEQVLNENEVINIENLRKGVYLVKISIMNNIVATCKLIK